ncbi:FAD binding domain-containing protein [Botrytis cinerea]
MFSLLLAGSTFVGAVYAASNVSVTNSSLAGTTVTTDYGTFTYSDASACACSQLSTSYPEHLYFPNTSNYTYYNLEAWDVRTNADPACVFSPTSADQVAAGVGIISTCDAQFAIRGGFPGANNINAGVMVALAGLNELQISADNTTIDVGPGNRWYDVYAYLEPYGRVVIGGRLKTIGVPGLTLIGGVHYFNNKYGYAMDNVVSYDVVLGNGTQVVASADCNPDLFWALKGGANNFVFDESGIEDFLQATCDLAANNDPSIAAGAVITTTYNATTGAMSASLLGVQAGTESPPSRFANFTAIPAVQAVNNVTSMATWAAKLDSPLQMFRVEFAVHSMKPNGTVLYQMWQMWKAAVEDVKDVVGFYPTFVTNLDPKSANTIAKTNGIGNVWGRDDAESGIWWQMSTGWDLAQDDLRMTTWIQKVMGNIHSFAIANNVSSEETDFIYMGDAGGWQDPFSTFPAENVEKMISIREKYDAEGVFSRLNWGGFKIPF